MDGNYGRKLGRRTETRTQLVAFLSTAQGAASASRFRSLSDLGRSRVETFLNSLVAPGAASAPHRAEEAARHPANQPGADPAPPPGHGAARRGYVLGGS